MMAMCQGNHEAGYTLVELLIAMGLLALVGALMTSSLEFGTRVSRQAQSELDNLDEMGTIREFLVNQIGQAYPFVDETASDPPSPLEGRDDALTFIAPLAEPWTQGGLYRFTFYLALGRNGRSLNLAWTPLTRGTGNPRTTLGAVDTVLIDGLADLKFAYLKRGDRESKGVWRSTWLDKEELPDLVRITVGFDDDDVSWPDLIVPLVIDADASCLYDPVSRRCRR